MKARKVKSLVCLRWVSCRCLIGVFCGCISHMQISKSLLRSESFLRAHFSEDISGETFFGAFPYYVDSWETLACFHHCLTIFQDKV